MKILSKYMYAEKDGSKKTTNFNEPRCQIDNEAQDVKDGIKNRLLMQDDYDTWLNETRETHRTIPYWGKPNAEWTVYIAESNKPTRIADMSEAVVMFREKFSAADVESVDEYKEQDNICNRYKKGRVNEAKMAELQRRIKMEERRIAAGE